MVTEWQIESSSRKCAHSGHTFEPGDEVLSLLVETVSGSLNRMDILAEHENEVSTEGSIVGRWKRVIKTPDTSEQEARKQQVQSTEELFLSMSQSVEPEHRSNSTRCMLYILALFLERKKVLKSVATRGIPQNYICFRHLKTKEEFLVEEILITPENLAHMENNLGILSGEGPDNHPVSGTSE